MDGEDAWPFTRWCWGHDSPDGEPPNCVKPRNNSTQNKLSFIRFWNMARRTYEESQRIPFVVIFILWGEVLDFHGYLGILYNKWSGSLNVDIEPHMWDGMMKLGRCLPEYMSKVVMISVLYSLQMRLMKFKMAAKNTRNSIFEIWVWRRIEEIGQIDVFSWRKHPE